MSRILIPGGCGYVGAVLAPHLLAEGHIVTVFDSMLFGDGGLPQENDHLTTIKGDIRDAEAFEKACEGQEAVIYLAGVTNNDLCGNPAAVGINATAFPICISGAKRAGVKRFVLASSVAAYGSSRGDATENEILIPTTKYAQAKHFCETWANLMKSKDFCVTITRSASVCGVSSRMRFDTTVNKMVHDACKTGVITVYGGEQKRSHISIQDICRAYKQLMILPPEVIAGETFNYVAENLTVKELAMMVAEVTGAKCLFKERSDDRSYSVSGEKARRILGFEPKQTIREVVEYMTTLFQGGYWKDTSAPKYTNIVAL